MSFISRHAPSRISTGVKAPARINQAEEIVQIPWVYQLALEGRVFVAGHGIEETETNSEASLVDTTPSIVLYAPSGGTLVIPLYFRAYLDTEGGGPGEPNWLFNYVQSDKTSGSAGTDLTPLNCLGGTSPRKAQAHCKHTLTSITAVSDAENVVMHERVHILDNFISVEGGTTKLGIEFPGNHSTTEFTWQPETPIILRNYSGIMFFSHTANTVSEYNYTVAWAELDEGTYGV